MTTFLQIFILIFAFSLSQDNWETKKKEAYLSEEKKVVKILKTLETKLSNKVLEDEYPMIIFPSIEFRVFVLNKGINKNNFIVNFVNDKDSVLWNTTFPPFSKEYKSFQFNPNERGKFYLESSIIEGDSSQAFIVLSVVRKI